MAWISAGTVSVTNGSTSVIGTGTSWFGSLQNGWGFVGPDGRVYEILTVDGATTLTLKTPYQGATAAAQAYAVFPTASLAGDLVAQLQALIANYQGVYDTVGQGRFPNGTLAEPGLTFDQDRDTGLYRAGVNILALVAGAVEQLRLAGGVASGAAVQSSTTDTAIGKLLTNGAHGLGGQIIEFSGDIDDAAVMPTGFYRVTGAATGTKPSNLGAFNLVQLRRGGSAPFGNTSQIVISEGGIYSRHINTGGAWTSWVRSYDSLNILGTVSQSGGVPTGALFQSGSNANGSFLRLPDGLQVCRARRTVNYATAQAMTATWTFPAAFAANPQIFLAVDEDSFTAGSAPSIYEVVSYYDSLGLSSVRLALGRINGMTSFVSGNSSGVDALAIGPWI